MNRKNVKYNILETLIMLTITYILYSLHFFDQFPVHATTKGKIYQMDPPSFHSHSIRISACDSHSN